MRVISIHHFPEFGGPQNRSLQLAAPLESRGIESIVIIPPGPAAERLRANQVQVKTVELGRVRASLSPSIQMKTWSRFPLDIFRLRQAMAEYEPDAILLHGLMNPHAAIAAKMLDIPLIWQLVDTRPPMKVRKAAIPFVKRFSDVVMSNGNGVANAHPGLDELLERKVVFYSAVDIERFSTSNRSAIRQELGIPETSPIVGVVGNVNPQKGHEHFIDAAIQTHRVYPDAKFVIVGQIYENHPTHSRYYSDLIERAQSSGLLVNRDLFFLGSRRDIPELLSAFDIFALASVPNSEGTPTAILEAMAAGLPVVSTNVGSVEEIVDTGRTGYVVRSEHPEEMADKLIGLLRSDDMRKQMGAAGRDKATTQFTVERCVDAHQAAFNIAIEHHNSKRKRR